LPGPLDGIRVIDVTTVLLGPYGTQILGDLGADVIKVEAPPTGDIARNMGLVRRPGMGGIYLNANRNKRSVALDLKHEGAKEVLRRLVATADVFVHNMRPQAIERLGFDYAAVSAIRPDIVYVGAYGFGQAGPYRAKPAYDDAIQAASGLASLFAMRDGTPQYVPAAVADKLVGVTLSQAVAMALLYRERTGRGQFVEVPMFEVLVSFNLVEHINGAAFEPPIGQLGYQRVTTSSRRPFRTRDGYVCILPYSDKQWLAFFTAVGRPEMMEIPGFATDADRRLHRSRVAQNLLGQEIARLPLDFGTGEPAMGELQPLDRRGGQRLRAQQLPTEALERKQLGLGGVQLPHGGPGSLGERRGGSAQLGLEIADRARDERPIAPGAPFTSGTHESRLPERAHVPPTSVLAHGLTFQSFCLSLKVSVIRFKLGESFPRLPGTGGGGCGRRTSAR